MRPHEGRWVRLIRPVASEGVDDQIREEAEHFDGDSSGQREPDGGHDGSGGEKFLHGSWNQRGETVTLESDSTRAPLVNSLRAASGQTAAARVVLNARGRSIWISFMVASLLPRTAIR